MLDTGRAMRILDRLLTGLTRFGARVIIFFMLG
jgi:hypothetical protein